MAVDATDERALSRACQGCEVIVNALNPPYDKWAAEVPRITEAVIGAARERKATVLLPGNVYNYGLEMPEDLSESTAHQASGKGAIREEMENAYRDSGVRTIVLRGGDFIEAAKTGNWFDSYLTKELSSNKLTYPGPTDVVHAWAYLPDMARAAVELAERRRELPRFASINFPGFSLSGAELHAALESVTGSSLKMKGFPWFSIRALGLFMPLMREVYEMKYLWDRPHRLVSEHFSQLLPDFEATPLREALADAVGVSEERQSSAA